MQDIIEELEHILQQIESDIEVYYSTKVKYYIKKNKIPEVDFYRGGLASLRDVKGYIRKEINRINNE